MVDSDNQNLCTIYPGPVLILAGPGTGKTHNLALRVKWLVENQKVDPEEIAVITFTTEAAINMRQRLCDKDKKDVYMPPGTQPSKISTMHSLGQKIIVKNCKDVGLTEKFKLVDSDSLRKIIFQDSAQLVNLTVQRG